jgi:predicted O-linked N-acetylglucosamine transferase (SPINDLY family)
VSGRLSPGNSVDALFAQAVERYGAGDLATAAAIAEQVLERTPDHAEALHLSGAAALDEGNLRRARARLSAALAAAPSSTEIANSLGKLALALEASGDIAGAESVLSVATETRPDFLVGHYALARLALRQENFEAASRRYSTALELDENFAAAHNGLGLALERLGRVEDAIPHYRRAATLDPANAGIFLNLARASHFTGRTADAMAAFRRCLDIDPGNQAAWNGYLFVMTFDGDTDIETHVRENRRWAARVTERIESAARRFPGPRDPDRRLRIGYVAAEFYGHVTAHYFMPVLRHHDRNGFEIACYSGGGKNDEMTERIRAGADLWRDLAGRHAADIADAIAGDGVDILVGIANYRAANRCVLAHRPAPVIVSYLNQVGTTGLAQVDYLIADERLYPRGKSDALFPEEIVRLGNFDVYALPGDDVAVAPPPVAGAGFVTFGCLSVAAKISPGVIALWARILNAVPGSRLRLVNSSLDDLTLRRRLVEQFRMHGVAPERLQTAGRYGGRSEYLDVYNRIDIALDTFPFGGGSVTYDALSMSTPVVALAGDYGYRRMTPGLLCATGFTELVAADVDEYFQIAVALAADPERISRYKRDIIARCRDTIFDAAVHVRELEAAYRAMWRRHCERMPV